MTHDTWAREALAFWLRRWLNLLVREYEQTASDCLERAAELRRLV